MATEVGAFWGGIAGGTISNILKYSFWGILLAVIGYFGYRIYLDKKIFKNKVRIWRQRANGLTKEINTKGGYILSKKGVTEFWIKIGRVKKRKMDGLPDPDMIDNEDRLYYFQLSPTDYIQTKTEFIYEPKYIENPDFKEPTEQEEKEILRVWALELKKQNDKLSDDESQELAKEKYLEWLEEERGQFINIGRLQVKPQNQASKEAVINDIIMTKNALGVDVNKQFMYFIGGVIAIIILGIVIFYIASNKGSLPLLEFAPLVFIKSKWRKK